MRRLHDANPREDGNQKGSYRAARWPRGVKLEHVWFIQNVESEGSDSKTE